MQTKMIVIVNTRMKNPIAWKITPFKDEVILKCEVVFLIAWVMINAFSKSIDIKISQE